MTNYYFCFWMGLGALTKRHEACNLFKGPRHAGLEGFPAGQSPKIAIINTNLGEPFNFK